MRVGDENGTLKTKVVTMKVASPKYQTLCSAQIPRPLEYATVKKVFANPTMMLVAKIVGRTMRI